MSELLTAIRPGKPWLDHFQMYEYDKAFAEYRKQFAPLYTAALAQQEPEALAAELLAEMEAVWKKKLPWNRTAERFSDRQMLVEYWSPLMLELEPAGRALAEAMQSLWAGKWPGEAYGIAGFEQLNDGFETTIMGIRMPKRKKS